MLSALVDVVKLSALQKPSEQGRVAEGETAHEANTPVSQALREDRQHECKTFALERKTGVVRLG